MNLLLQSRALLGWLVVGLGLMSGPPAARAAEGSLKIQSMLIWGTNDPKPEGAKLRDLDPNLRKRLRGVFKWKDYYEVKRKVFVASKQRNQRVRLSDKCEIAVQDLGSSTIEVRLFGEGNFVVTKRQTMKPGGLLILAGADKDDTAWFVAITLAPEKE